MYMSKKNKAGFLLIKGETYPYDVLVSIGTTKEQILEYSKRKFIDCFTDEEITALTDLPSKKGYTLMLHNRALFLWLKHFPEKPEHYGFLAHEIFHAADLMLRRAGMSLSDDSDEAWAYQIDWLTKKIYQEFKI